MAVDDGSLVIEKNLKLESETDKEILQEDMNDYLDDLLHLCMGHCENWVRASRSGWGANGPFAERIVIDPEENQGHAPQPVVPVSQR
jgi:hypothetical protein